MNYTLENVTENIEAWFNKDPVRPELSIEFRTDRGREVFGLKDEAGEYKAFCCLATTTSVPRSIKELDELTSEFGVFIIPYTVWSYQRGAGREIINQLVSLAGQSRSIIRVVTLSPLTDMARKFHLRNNAIELQVNEATANFEYSLWPI
tara:strand:- start:534 stop:980 length:447 start_codon:yes stop_codon:yes gene_type:complete